MMPLRERESMFRSDTETQVQQRFITFLIASSLCLLFSARLFTIVVKKSLRGRQLRYALVPFRFRGRTCVGESSFFT